MVNSTHTKRFQIYNAGMRQHAEDDMSAVAEIYLNRVNARPAQT
jgi:hypothetical protein